MYRPQRAWEMGVLISFWVGLSESVNDKWLGWTPPVSIFRVPVYLFFLAACVWSCFSWTGPDQVTPTLSVCTNL